MFRFKPPYKYVPTIIGFRYPIKQIQRLFKTTIKQIKPLYKKINSSDDFIYKSLSVS